MTAPLPNDRTAAQLAAELTAAGYPVSSRTVEGWRRGRAPSKLAAAGLRVLAERRERAAAAQFNRR